MNDILNGDVPSIFVYDNVSYMLSHGWLKNFKQNAMIPNAVKYYDLDLKLKRELKKKL